MPAIISAMATYFVARFTLKKEAIAALYRNDFVVLKNLVQDIYDKLTNLEFSPEEIPKLVSLGFEVEQLQRQIKKMNLKDNTLQTLIRKFIEIYKERDNLRSTYHDSF